MIDHVVSKKHLFVCLKWHSIEEISELTDYLLPRFGVKESV